MLNFQVKLVGWIEERILRNAKRVFGVDLAFGGTEERWGTHYSINISSLMKFKIINR